MAQTGEMKATTTRAIPNGANGRTGMFGQPSHQLIADAIRT
jgi:hypothetical protein